MHVHLIINMCTSLLFLLLLLKYFPCLNCLELRIFFKVNFCQSLWELSSPRLELIWYFEIIGYMLQFSSVQSLSRIRLFATPWIAACQASLSITNSQSSFRFASIESVMRSSHLILCRPLLLLPSIFLMTGSFQISQLFSSGGQSIGVSASTSVLPMNTQD